MSERDLIERLRAKLPGIETPMMGGDNLAVTLCSYFDNPSQPDDETGWSEDAVRGQYEVLDAIHAHYATTIARLSEALAEARRQGAEDWQPIETAPRNGTAVIVCDPSRDSHDPIVGEAYCNEARGGWWWANTSDTQLAAEPIDPPPTHWRPLPAPPCEISQGGEASQAALAEPGENQISGSEFGERHG